MENLRKNGWVLNEQYLTCCGEIMLDWKPEGKLSVIRMCFFCGHVDFIQTEDEQEFEKELSVTCPCCSGELFEDENPSHNDEQEAGEKQ